MTRYALAILIALLFTGIEKLNSSLPHVKSQRIVAVYVAAEEIQKEHVEYSTLECENFISTSTTFSTSVTARGNSSSHNFTRQRYVQTTKHAIHIAPCRHQGLLTDIFNFNLYTSSLRIVYYLHTLCRLRI